jgi:hypothetical protein
MIKTSDLPTNPSDAFQVLLRELQLAANAFPNGSLEA